MAEYIYTKTDVITNRLQCEIKANEDIITPLTYVLWNLPDDLRVVFDSSIDVNEKANLDEVVANHPDELSECSEINTSGNIIPPSGTVSGTASGTTAIPDGFGGFVYMNLLELDHSKLGNLDSDDHLQYVPRNGSRGFTSTVSGVDPTEDYHLTTRWYVDNTIDTAISTWASYEYEISSEDTNSTTSTSYQEKVSLVVDNLPAGKYRLDWYYEWAYSHGNFQFKSRVQIDDTDTYMEQEVRPAQASTTKFRDSSGFVYVNLTSGHHHIDLDYCSSKNKKTSYIRRARIALRRVS